MKRRFRFANYGLLLFPIRFLRIGFLSTGRKKFYLSRAGKKLSFIDSFTIAQRYDSIPVRNNSAIIETTRGEKKPPIFVIYLESTFHRIPPKKEKSHVEEKSRETMLTLVRDSIRIRRARSNLFQKICSIRTWKLYNGAPFIPRSFIKTKFYPSRRWESSNRLNIIRTKNIGENRVRTASLHRLIVDSIPQPRSKEIRSVRRKLEISFHFVGIDRYRSEEINIEIGIRIRNCTPGGKRIAFTKV